MESSTCASAAVCPLCQLFGAVHVLDLTASPKIADMATVMKEIRYPLEVIIANKEASDR